VTIDGSTATGWSATKPPLVEVISGGEVNGASAFTVDGPGAAVIQDLTVAGVTANGFGVGVDVLASPSVTVQRNQFGVIADANAVAGPLMRAGVRITGGEKDRRVSQNLISRGGCPRRAWVAARCQRHLRSPGSLPPTIDHRTVARERAGRS
jgi:hypothetical protein